jgi:hypothetical protein
MRQEMEVTVRRLGSTARFAAFLVALVLVSSFALGCAAVDPRPASPALQAKVTNAVTTVAATDIISVKVFESGRVDLQLGIAKDTNGLNGADVGAETIGKLVSEEILTKVSEVNEVRVTDLNGAYVDTFKRQ